MAFLFRLTVEVTVYAVVVAVEPTELNIRYINYNNSSNMTIITIKLCNKNIA